MKKIITLTLILFICIPIFTFAQDVNDKLKLNNNDLINLSKQSIVKVFYSVEGVLRIPDFSFDYSNYEIKLNKNNKYIDVDIENDVYGTGFIVSDDGYIVTNSHVIESSISDVYKNVIKSYLDNATEAEIKSALKQNKNLKEAYKKAGDIIYEFMVENSKEYLKENIVILKPNDTATEFSELVKNGYKAKNLYSNVYYNKDNKDIAILKIDANNIPTLPLASTESEGVYSGQKVFTFGFPSSAFFGGSDFLEPTFSEGLITAIKNQNDINIYQTDAKISIGSSGSPLFDDQGNVVGIITYTSSDESGGDNFGFALPVSLIKEKLEYLKINLIDNEYFNKYKLSLTFLKNNECKKAIDNFEKINPINDDFKIESLIKDKIDYCNNLIDSGKSNDSFISSLILFVKSNLNVFVILLIIIILILIISLFTKKLLKRIKKDENIIKEIEEVLEKDINVNINGLSEHDNKITTSNKN